MEDEKKKKKNRKKKSKQIKTEGDVAVGESTNAYQNHVIEHNPQNQVSESTEVQNDAEKTDVDLDRSHANGTEGARLEEMIKKLQKENETYIKKEASMNEIVKELQKENDIHIQKETGMEETIKKLQSENDTHIFKETSLERELMQLQGEKGSWLQKEAGFGQKINSLVDETSILSLKVVSLEEKVKQLEREIDSWVQKENSNKGTIASLNGDNTSLQAQVMELEESRNNLLQENQRLTESMFGLQSQIQTLEKSTAATHTSTVMTLHDSGSEDMNAQMDALRQLVEKLVAENAELVDKVNQLYIELDRLGVTSDPSSAVGSDPTVGTAETIGITVPMSEFSEKTSESGERMGSFIGILVKEEDRKGGDNVNAKDTTFVADSMSESRKGTSLLGKRVESPEDNVIIAEGQDSQYNYAKESIDIPISAETFDSEEIVQIPLDENEAGGVPELQAIHDDAKIDVPLTHAPLIGAPFRLISFVASYVSGADLVNKSSVNSGRVNSHN